eukprot:jgi/Chlat1/1216/Chrsp115S08652
MGQVFGTLGSIAGVIGVETPKYEVVKKAADYEIRQYPPCVVAEVSYGGKRTDGRAGFMPLAKYIGALGAADNEPASKLAMTAPVLTSSNKQGGEKIAMTAPVITQGGGGGSSGDGGDAASNVMQFVLPSKITSAALAPKPTNPNVRVLDMPGRKVAVTTFSGWVNEKVEAERAARLKAALARDGVKAKEGSDAKLAQYNPPWTLGPLRTNEVMVEVE